MLAPFPVGVLAALGRKDLTSPDGAHLVETRPWRAHGSATVVRLDLEEARWVVVDLENAMGCGNGLCLRDNPRVDAVRCG